MYCVDRVTEKPDAELTSPSGNQKSQHKLKYLRSLDDLSRFDTSGTNLSPAVAASRELDTDRLKIRVKSSSRFVISV